jgi:hypothetical protein
MGDESSDRKRKSENPLEEDDEQEKALPKGWEKRLSRSSSTF